jgi:hypothetical protein
MMRPTETLIRDDLGSLAELKRAANRVGAHARAVRRWRLWEGRAFCAVTGFGLLVIAALLHDCWWPY